MKSKVFTVLFFTICLSYTSCEKDEEKKINHYTTNLQPNADVGIDAFIYDLEPDRNLGTHPDFMSAAWTIGGVPVIYRSFIKFDFSTIPIDATIDSVKLSLYSYNSPANGSHSPLDGSNSCILQRVNSSWEENFLTWNNQPSTTTENQVILSQSHNEIQHYLEIDVTKLTKEMIKTASNNYGFMLKLETEEYYRRMVFASSDNNDSEIHPKLDIYYTIEE